MEAGFELGGDAEAARVGCEEGVAAFADE